MRKVWWRCGQCDHSWETTVASRAGGTGCPACWNRRRGGHVQCRTAGALTRASRATGRGRVASKPEPARTRSAHARRAVIQDRLVVMRRLRARVAGARRGSRDRHPLPDVRTGSAADAGCLTAGDTRQGVPRSASRREAPLPSTSMPDFAHETFMTVAEVAAALRMNQQTIRNWIDAGQLPAVRIGRRVRVLSSDFAALIDNDARRPATGAPDSSHHVRAQQFWDGDWIPDTAVP